MLRSRDWFPWEFQAFTNEPRNDSTRHFVLRLTRVRAAKWIGYHGSRRQQAFESGPAEMSKPTLYLGKADHGIPLSHREFAEADYHEPWRYERVNGRLVVMPPAGHDRSVTGKPIRNQLGAYEIAHPEVVDHVISEAWIFIDEDTDRIADIGVYLRGPRSGERIPDRVPELVVEVLSQGSEAHRRDYEEKKTEYRRVGVKEYVIVDRFAHRLTVFRLAGKRYRQTELSPDDTYTTPLLPGFQIPLAGLL
jgi:Uma2 family endonuclease